MTKDILEAYVTEGKSIRQIAFLVCKSYTTVQYYLNKYGLKTVNVKKYDKDSLFKVCTKCLKELAVDNFYKKNLGYHSTCKNCFNKRCADRQKEFKHECLEYLGNSCIKCGYNKCSAALEFHHKNPSSKEFDLSKVKSFKLSSLIKKELDKCVVLCSNCHREEHWSNNN